MEVREWSYQEFPAFTQDIPGVQRIPTTGQEMGVNYLHDVEYANVNGTPLHLQILIPASRSSGFQPFAETQPFALPCVVYVQGSGWFEQYVYANLVQLAKLAARGFVCAIVQYRHSGIASFPAQAVDARNAVRFLRQNAARYGIDPEKMLLSGDSSGGHTAMWGGMLHNDGDPAQNLFPGVSGEVKGIVNYYGSTSVMAPDSNPQTVNHCLPDSPEGRVMGRKDLLANPELAKQLSVECNITRETELAPVLIFHGTKDRTVNCTGSVVLYNTLKETGHPVEMYLIEGADHGGPEFWTDQVLDIVEHFIRSCLNS